MDMHAPSSSAAVESAAQAIEAWNPVTKAMLKPLVEDARRAAAELDARVEDGASPGLLHGMTVSLKDNIDVAGVATTAGSSILKDNIANSDAFVTTRLKRAGATIVGKANLHEWVFGPTSQSRHYGPVRNPWNPAHVPGGSSGGSGASVASGMCTVSIGSDTAGSIRLPAAFCGVAGLRATAGRISTRGSLPVSQPFDALGPLARRVSDIARVFTVIAGYDPHDPISVPESVPSVLTTIDDPIEGIRIGVMRRYFFEDIDAELASAIEEVIEVYRSLGAEIVEIDIPEAEASQAQLSFAIVIADAYALHKDRLAERGSDYGADVHERFMLGKAVTAVQYSQALRWLERFRQALRGTFGQVDAIITPTTPDPAPATDYPDFIAAVRRITRFTPAWAAAGNPSLALPCGFSTSGLPLSFELATAWWKEEPLLRLGHAYQQVTRHHLAEPKLPK